MFIQAQKKETLRKLQASAAKSCQVLNMQRVQVSKQLSQSRIRCTHTIDLLRTSVATDAPRDYLGFHGSGLCHSGPKSTTHESRKISEKWQNSFTKNHTHKFGNHQIPLKLIPTNLDSIKKGTLEMARPRTIEYLSSPSPFPNKYRFQLNPKMMQKFPYFIEKSMYRLSF